MKVNSEPSQPDNSAAKLTPFYKSLTKEQKIVIIISLIGLPTVIAGCLGIRAILPTEVTETPVPALVSPTVENQSESQTPIKVDIKAILSQYQKLTPAEQARVDDLFNDFASAIVNSETRFHYPILADNDNNELVITTEQSSLMVSFIQNLLLNSIIPANVSQENLKMIVTQILEENKSGINANVIAIFWFRDERGIEQKIEITRATLRYNSKGYMIYFMRNPDETFSQVLFFKDRLVLDKGEISDLPSDVWLGLSTLLNEGTALNAKSLATLSRDGKITPVLTTSENGEDNLIRTADGHGFYEGIIPENPNNQGQIVKQDIGQTMNVSNISERKIPTAVAATPIPPTPTTAPTIPPVPTEAQPTPTAKVEDISFLAPPVLIDNDKTFLDFKIGQGLTEAEAMEKLKEIWLMVVAAKLNISYEDLTKQLANGSLKTTELTYPNSDWAKNIREEEKTSTVDLTKSLIIEFGEYGTPGVPKDTVGVGGAVRVDFQVDEKTQQMKMVIYRLPNPSGGPLSPAIFIGSFEQALSFFYFGKVTDEQVIKDQETMDKINDILGVTEYMKEGNEEKLLIIATRNSK